MTWDFAPIALVALGLSGGSVHESVHANHGGRWIPATERCRLTADKRMPLTAEPLNPDDQHEIIRRVNQERDQAPGVWAEMQRAQRHRDVITLVAAALVLHRIHDHNRVHERRQGCSRRRGQAGEHLLGRAVQLPPVHASDAEPGLDLFPAHPLVRRRQIPVSVAVDAS
jgi:hypothetical protein